MLNLPRPTGSALALSQEGFDNGCFSREASAARDRARPSPPTPVPNVAEALDAFLSRVQGPDQSVAAGRPGPEEGPATVSVTRSQVAIQPQFEEWPRLSPGAGTGEGIAHDPDELAGQRIRMMEHAARG